MLHVIRVGNARVSLITVGEIALPLAASMIRPAVSTGDDTDLAEFEAQRLIPLQDALIEIDDATVLVDAGRYDLPEGSTYQVPGYAPPPDLRTRLARLGVVPEDITHLVITHRHWDHFNGATVEFEGDPRPAFPRARHYLGAADWPAVAAACQDPGSIESRSLAVVHRAGLLELVAGEGSIAPGVRIIPAPGETPGHQIVRLESAGEVFYALGDLYHHPVECPRPGWMVRWADPATNLTSRRALGTAAVREGARLFASHIPGLGVLRGDPARPTWVAVA